MWSRPKPTPPPVQGRTTMETWSRPLTTNQPRHTRTHAYTHKSKGVLNTIPEWPHNLHQGPSSFSMWKRWRYLGSRMLPQLLEGLPALLHVLNWHSSVALSLAPAPVFVVQGIQGKSAGVKGLSHGPERLTEPGHELSTEPR